MSDETTTKDSAERTYAAERALDGGPSKKPRKPATAYGMTCWPATHESWAVRRHAYLARDALGQIDAPTARRMAAWLIRAAEWMEAGNG